MEKQKPNQKQKFNPSVDLRSDLWETLSINDLWTQRALLNSRIAISGHLNVSMVSQLNRGLTILDEIIDRKTEAEFDLAEKVVLR